MVEQANKQDLDIQSFSKYVADPNAAGLAESGDLARALAKFPYCQLLHLFYTHSLSDSKPLGYDRQLSRAALFVPDRTVLYSILKAPEQLISSGTVKEAIKQKEPVSPKKEDIPLSSGWESLDEPPADIPDPFATWVDASEPDEEPEIGEKQADPFIEEEEEINRKHESINSKTRHKQGNGADLIENLFNNIIGANAEAPAPDTFEKKSEPVSAPAEDEVIVQPEKEAQSESVLKAEIAAQPHEEFVPVEEPAEGRTPDSDIEESIQEEEQKVSKYNDDNMPYSFLWWLNKTRKEHSGTYQPYVDFKLETSQNIRKNSADQLSTQIIENIFHLQSPLDQLENAPKTIPFQVKRREDFILEKFIKEEPQIKPPNSQKLDTENKARKSAEDPNDLVSETLAQIYTDQMLFQKAIDTYKKLCLKFPEKSTYFADQILELEKKVN